jgi:hypothetical protein
LFAAPRSLSQLAASFIDTYRQGIHCLPLVAWKFFTSTTHQYSIVKDQTPIADFGLEISDYEQLLSGSDSEIKIPQSAIDLAPTDPPRSLQILVELMGIEPTTSWMQITRSPSWATAPQIISDCGLAISEWPSTLQASQFQNPQSAIRNLVGLGRVELPTSPLSGVRSSQLSYRPIPLAYSIKRSAGTPTTGRSPAAFQALRFQLRGRALR